MKPEEVHDKFDKISEANPEAAITIVHDILVTPATEEEKKEDLQIMKTLKDKISNSD